VPILRAPQLTEDAEAVFYFPGCGSERLFSDIGLRKSEEITQGVRDLTGRDKAEPGPVKMLTACPACHQGLAKYADETGVTRDYIVVEMAKHLLGEGWQQRFMERVKAGGVEKVLLRTLDPAGARRRIT
jgi:Fe-S oxidoreductase